jgi:sugar O-acyltransferase (sialic acid O-acetyltransferase NeuD family)
MQLCERTVGVYLFGSNIITRLLAEFMCKDSRYRLLGVTLNEEYCDTDSLFGYPLVSFEKLAHKGGDFGIINCAGFSNQQKVRASIDAKIREKQIPLLSFFHPSAEVSSVDFGESNIVMCNAVIEPYSTVGDDNVFYGGSYICHEADIGNYNWFSTGSVLAGGVTVGNHNFFGVNSCLKEELTVGSAATVGMGAVVIRDVPDSVSVVGNPAEVMNFQR